MKSKLICFPAALAAVTLSMVPATAQLRGPSTGQVNAIQTPITRMNFAQFLLNAGFNATYDQNVNAYRFQQPVTGKTGTFGTWLSQDLRSSEVGISLSLLAINNESVASEITRRLARENAIHAPVTFKLMACQTGESCKYLLSAYIWLDLARVDEKVFRASVNRLVSVAESTRDLWDSRR